MNILYLYATEIDPLKGGIQRVTYVLSEYFRSKGHNVYYLGVEKGNSPYQLTMPCIELNSPTNLDYIQKIIIDYQIDIAIFQAGVSPLYASWAYTAKSAGIRLISCIHNSMLGSVNNLKGVFYPQFKRYHLQFAFFVLECRWIKYILRKIYIFSKRKHYNKLLVKSDKVILLSDSFRSDLSQFVDLSKFEGKICAIPNPISFKSEEFCPQNKQKRVLFVGRIDDKQKRVDLLLKIWENVCLNFSDWSLDIVGDGLYLRTAKKYVKDRNIPRVNFYGFCDPRPYYENSKIFCMTSSSEGFGIVLIEAMQYGVVPLAFNSYLSVTDIIDDKKNGFVISPFNIEEYVCKLQYLMSHEKELRMMAQEARNKSTNFTLDNIGLKWEKLLLYK